MSSNTGSTFELYAASAPVGLNIRPSTSTDIIGPIEQSATRPKLSCSAFLSVRIAAAPTPSAIMKGTVMGPVVTPPESNATARNSLGTNIDTTNTAA